MQDPCRPGVREAVELCTHAGVKVSILFERASDMNAHCKLLT